MKKILIFSLCNISLIVSCNQNLPPIPYVDFDESMQLARYHDMLEKPGASKILQIFREQYLNMNPTRVQITPLLRIPKIIHQIWIGPRPFPEEFKKYQGSWIKHHPDWKYKLWANEDIPHFAFKNKDLFEREKNYSAKSDIWRYEILERYGGVYVDTDFECLKPLDSLHYAYDFYTGIQPLDTAYTQLGAGIIGSIPGHPILRCCIENFKKNQDNPHIVARVGPLYFTQIFLACIGKTGLRDLAFPASYFYPCGYNQKGRPVEEWIRPESYAVHHWAGSWLCPEAFAP